MSKVAVHKVDPTEPPSASSVHQLRLIFDRIEQRAYELFEQRGSAHGKDLDDWLDAEREYLFVPQGEMVEKERGFELTLDDSRFSSR